MSYNKERLEMGEQSDVRPDLLGSPPVGTAFGAAVGATADGFVGKRVADLTDPAAEDAHWLEKTTRHPHTVGASSYDEYGPAYRYGVDSFGRYPQSDVDGFARSRGWNASRDTSSRDRDRAKHAVRDAWNRLSDSVEGAIPGRRGPRRSTMKLLLGCLITLSTATAQAQTTTTPSAPLPDATPHLYRNGALIRSDLADWATCVRAARDDAAARMDYTQTYRCDTSGTSFTINLDVAPPPPPPNCSTTQPAAQVRTQACPAGTTGSWVQTNAYIAAPAPTCWVSSTWLPTVAPSGTCVPVSTPPGGTSVSFTNLMNVRGADNQGSRTTPTVALAANRLALLSVVNVATTPVIPTVSGWDQVRTYVHGDIQRHTVFRRMSGAPSVSTHTINVGSQSQFYLLWSIDESDDNVDTSGINGSGAIVQSAVAGRMAETSTLLNIALAPFVNSINTSFGSFSIGYQANQMTVGSGFTKLASPGMGSFSDRAMFIQYKPASDTSVDMNTFANVDIWSGIALEIKAK